MKKRFIYLTTIPLAGLFLFAYFFISSNNKIVDDANTLNLLIKLNFIENLLVHEIQKERGISSIYLHSEGNEYLEELNQQRKITDKAKINRVNFLEKHSELSAIYNIDKEFNHLTNIRNEITQLSINPQAMLEYYSSLNSHLISHILNTNELTQTAKLNNLLHAYYYLVQSKEYAGIERATIAQLIRIQASTPKIKQKFAELINAQSVYTELFNQTANDSVLQYYQQKMKHDSIYNIEKLRNEIRNSTLLNLFTNTWFGDATQRIEQLQLIENFIVDIIMQEVKTIKYETETKLMMSWAYSLFTLVLVVILSSKFFSSISQQIEQKEKLNIQSAELHKFKLIIENTPNSIFITTPSGHIEYVNKHFINQTGFKPEDVLGQRPSIWRTDGTPKETYESLYSHIEKGKYWRGELLNKKKDNNIYWAKTLIFPVKNTLNAVIHYIAIQEDITQYKHDKEKIEYLVNHDDLTGLPSLRLGKDRLNQALLAAKRHKVGAGVMFIDLDGFKAINDEHGHAAGDNVLIEIGKRITENLRQTDTVARIGGDEFMVVLTNIKDYKAIERVAVKIINNVKQPIYYNYSPLKVTASIGIALYPRHGDSSEELLKKADKAMYEVKNSGSNNFKMFTL